MASVILKISSVVLLGATMIAGNAYAGGFSRGEANTDILFEPGQYGFDAGFIYVSPQVSYATIGTGGAVGTDPRFSQDYWIPSVAAKARFGDALGCALTYTQPFGGSTVYGTQAQAAQVGKKFYSKDFVSNEYGATCDVRFDAGPGKFHVLGGAYLQDFTYTAVSNLGTLKLNDGGSYGYRIGAAYDIDKYAMRAAVMYRSAVTQNATGTFTPTATGAFVFGTSSVIPSTGNGTLPQSVKLSLQSGVAPGWLVYGSVEWTNWSVLQTLNYSISTSAQQDKYYWKDGWTIQAGVGHQFTDDIAGTINVTWDQGVGSGADIMTDKWTVGTGAEFKLGPGKLQVGGAVTYITGGSQSTANGASFNATTNGSWAYSAGAGYKVSF